MFSTTYESVTVPVSRDRKMRTALSKALVTKRMAGFVTEPSGRKKNKCYLDCKICVTWFIHQQKWGMVFPRDVVQLAFVFSFI